MQWQAPSLALAAQAFLLTIALNPDLEDRPLSISIVCAVGVLMTIMAYQLMARHRYYFQLDQADMKRLEETIGLLHISHRPTQRKRRSEIRPPLAGKTPSFYVWQVGFLIVALVDVGIALAAWLPPLWVGTGYVVALLTLWACFLISLPLVFALRALEDPADHED